MRFILSFVTILLFGIYVYADENIALSDDAAANDNVLLDNVTADNMSLDNKTTKNKIKPKLVPDRLINDKNSFMEDFGFPDREKFSISTNVNAKDRGLYNDVELSMKNRWSTTNIWGKDFLYIESVLAGGIYGFNYYSVKPSKAKQKEYVIPYGSLSLKLFSGTVFSPELIIKDSKFIFSNGGSSLDKQTDNYNYYFLKLPLGFYIPFFGWRAEGYIDGSYSNLNNNFSVQDSLMVQGSLLEEGSDFSLSSTKWNVRLYLDTPVVLKPSITEYSYFGVFYEETRSARTATPGEDYEGEYTLLVDGISRVGGIFYDMRLNVYKGFMFGINAYIGVGDIETSHKYDVSYGNTDGIVYYNAELTLGYQHIFKEHGVGIAFDAGAGYSGFVEFFYGKKDTLYNLSLDGDIRYFAELRFLFGW